MGFQSFGFPFDRRPWISHIAGVLRKAFGRVVVVGAPNAEFPKPIRNSCAMKCRMKVWWLATLVFSEDEVRQVDPQGRGLSSSTHRRIIKPRFTNGSPTVAKLADRAATHTYWP
jgi:hypothetical protein